MLGGVEYLSIDDAGLHVTVNGEPRLLEVDHVVLCAGQESLTVQVEHRAAATADASIYEQVLAQRLGVKVGVVLVEPGVTSALTDVEKRQKPIRLIDRRGST